MKPIFPFVNGNATTITQLIPARSWHAIYEDKEEGEVSIPLVAWALTETIEDGEKFQYVIGLDGCDEGIIMACDRNINFKRYDYVEV